MVRDAWAVYSYCLCSQHSSNKVSYGSQRTFYTRLKFWLEMSPEDMCLLEKCWNVAVHFEPQTCNTRVTLPLGKHHPPPPKEIAR